MLYDEFSAINKESRIQEILSPPLWFPYYSVLRTAFCKKWLALIILDPEFKEKEVSIDKLYQSLLYEWELHHYSNHIRGIPIPTPPHLYQLEDAVKYFYYKQVVIETIRPSTKYIFSAYPRRLPSQKQSPPPKRVNGVLYAISSIFKVLTGEESKD